MIIHKTYNHLLELDDLNLESNLSFLTLQDQAIMDSVKALEVEEKAYFQRDMLSLFRSFLAFSAQAHKVYLIFIEPYPQTKSRIRSKKGLFCAHREIFERPTTYEVEIEVSPDKTFLAGITQVTASNINDVVNYMDELPFAFGLAVSQQKKTFTNSRKKMLQTIVNHGLKPGKIYWKNWPKIAALLVKPERKIFTLQTLNDSEYFRIFYHSADEQWEQELKHFFTQQLQNSPVFEN